LDAFNSEFIINDPLAKLDDKLRVGKFAVFCMLRKEYKLLDVTLVAFVKLECLLREEDRQWVRVAIVFTNIGK
jgi:hypothetical protein